MSVEGSGPPRRYSGVTGPDMRAVAVEGAYDRFCGRPLNRNPYSRDELPNASIAWDDGWREFNSLLGQGVAREVRRWLDDE